MERLSSPLPDRIHFKAGMIKLYMTELASPPTDGENKTAK